MADDKDKNKLLSIDYDDDNENYDSFLDFIENDSFLRKKSFVDEVMTNGESYLEEIKRKKILQEKEKNKLIKYIIKHNKKYSKEELEKYSIHDIRNIYNETKLSKRKILNFLYFFFYKKE